MLDKEQRAMVDACNKRSPRDNNAIEYVRQIINIERNSFFAGWKEAAMYYRAPEDVTPGDDDIGAVVQICKEQKRNLHLFTSGNDDGRWVLSIGNRPPDPGSIAWEGYAFEDAWKAAAERLKENG